MKRSTLHAVALICGFSVIASAGASTQLRAVPGDSHETTVSDGKIQPPVKFSTVWADDKGLRMSATAALKDWNIKAMRRRLHRSGLACRLMKLKALLTPCCRRVMSVAGIMLQARSG